MPILRFIRSHVIMISVLIAVVVIGSGFWAGISESAAQRSALAGHAADLAHGFLDGELAQLKGSESDQRLLLQASLRRRLQMVDQMHFGASRAFLLRRDDPRSPVVFLADSAPLGLPGVLYGAATVPVELTAALDGTPPTAVLTSLEGSGRNWIAFAGVAPSDGSARRHVVGLVADGVRWDREQWHAGVRGGFHALLLLGSPWLAVVLVWRRVDRDTRIRNLSVAIEQVDAFVVIISPEDRVEYVNRALCRQLRQSPEALIGRHWREIGVVDRSSDAGREMIAAIERGEGWSGEWAMPGNGQPTVFCLGAITPVRRENGALACVVFVGSDFTGEKARESELREARVRALAADQAKRQFLTAMSHEVRTPLNGIIGFAGLLAEGPLASDQRTYVDAILGSANSLVGITEDLIDYSRMTSGRIELEEAPLAVEECVGSVIDRVAARAEAKGLELTCRLDANVPAIVRADVRRLAQVLGNLLGNAVKFTDRGHVELAVRLLAPTGPGRQVIEFSVADTGIGIEPRDHELIFRQFSQVDNAEAHRRGGMGLGLAMARHLVELMGGRLTFVSEVGRGSTFTFAISVAVEGGDPVIRRLPGLKVGVVAPAGRTRDLLVQLLSDWSAIPSVAEEPASLVAEPFDAVLVSLTTTEACAEVRPGVVARDLACGRIIALVPHSLPQPVRADLAPRYDSLLVRPPRPGELYAALSRSRAQEVVPADLPAPFDLSILVAEDNATSQWLMREMLSSLGCRHHLVGSGQEVLDELRSNPSRYDLLLLDLRLPEINGLAVLRAIRSGDAGAALQRLWIVALTAEVRLDQRDIAFAGGLNDHVIKPLRVEVLAAALRRYVEARRRGLTA